MQALWLEDNQLSYCSNLPLPTPSVEEALVKIRLAGICATDLELVKGYYPYTGILGHEFVGEIVQAPTAPTRIGQRVVGEINIACGQCERCLNGYAKHCQQRRILGIRNQSGAFAEYLCLPLKNLLPVPMSLPDEIAVFTEPLAAALAIQAQVHIVPTHQVLVIGAGRLGQLIAQTLKLTSCYLRVVARHESQRQLLTTQQITCLDELTVPQQTFDIVIEATGSVNGFSLARQAIRPGGTIVLKSTYRGDMTINFSSLVVDEIRLVGSRCGPLASALRLLEQQLIAPLPLIDSYFSLQEGLRAFKRANQAGVFKVLLICS
jgi:threonine dehydrogenase-like Zn-dependent dehydrogenase